MEIDVSPEPDPAEREALERAVARGLGRPADARGEWWREGVRENVLDDAADEGHPPA
jgi:hypothetical protein